MKVSIIVPTYQGRNLLSKFLPRLLQSLGGYDSYEIICVDNGSSDGSASYIQKEHPSVELIALNKNFGFTRAVNEGVQKAKGEYVLILNNDCFLEKDTLHKLLDFIQEKSLVATQPVILKPNNSDTNGSTIESIGYTVNLFKGKAEVVKDLSFFEDMNLNRSQKDLWEKGSVYGLSGTCLLIKKDVFTTVGMFDESFHSYLEDVDLFIRLAKQGYLFAPCLKAEARHEHMATSSKMGHYKEWHDFTNWIRVIVKNYPPFFVFKHFPILLLERLRNISGLFKKLLYYAK